MPAAPANKPASSADALAAKVAPPQPGEIQIDAELVCPQFETGAAVVGKVIGKDKDWVRLRIEELGRDWIVRPNRIDLAKASWDHVAADYPAVGENKAFDQDFRPAAVAAEDKGLVEKIHAKGEELLAMLPPEMRQAAQSMLASATGKLGGAPTNTVYARWIGRGTLAGAYLKAGSREVARDAKTGTEGFFPKATVEKYEKRQERAGEKFFERL